LQHLRFRTGPDVAAADADRVENRDPGEVDAARLDEGGAIRERPFGYKGVFERF
jgi:hypothetical protein